MWAPIKIYVGSSYGTVLCCAVLYSMLHPRTVLELLRLGATPRTAPLHGALRQGWPAEDDQCVRI